MNELAATTSKTSGFNPTEIIFILAIVAVVYLLLIRPQQRRRQQAQQRQSTVQPGARVVTTAGLYATVVAVDGDDLILEVAPGVEMRYMKRAIMNVVDVPEPAAETGEDEVPADETGEDYDAGEPSDSIVEDDDLAGEVPVSDGTVSDGTDAEETAYEQATGRKQD